MAQTKLGRKTKVSLKGLNDRQRRFALEYMLDHEPKAAAIRAGYNKNSAAVTAQKLLKHPTVKAYIEAEETADVKRLELDREEVLRQLYYALTRCNSDFRNPDGSLIPSGQLNERAEATIDGYEVDETIDPETGEVVKRKTKVKITPKLGGIEMAMKHKGLFQPDQINLQIPILQQFFDQLAGASSRDPIEERLESERALLEGESGLSAIVEGHRQSLSTDTEEPSNEPT